MASFCERPSSGAKLDKISWQFMEKHRRIGFPDDPEYVAELRALPQFSWQDFVAGLTPLDEGSDSDLKTLLGELRVSPSIYWYPGSGDDFRPLVFDVPNNAVGRRLFRTTCPDLAEDPVIFWMNDYAVDYAETPRYKTPAAEIRVKAQDYQWLAMAKYNSELAIAERVERYVFRDRLPVTLLTVSVKNRRQGNHDRPEGGDTYLVVFSNVPSHVLFEEAILPMRLNVSCVLLSKQGGFAGEIYNYNQYEQIPALLRTFEPELGLVDLFLIDMNGQDVWPVRPRFANIKDYEYVGGPVPLGWVPCRAFGRPGLKYELEKRLDNPNLEVIGSRVVSDFERVAWTLATRDDSPFVGMIGRLKIEKEQLFVLHSVAQCIEEMFSHGPLAETSIEDKATITIRYWQIIQDCHSKQFDDLGKLGVRGQGRGAFEYKLLEMEGFVAWSRIGTQIIGTAFRALSQEMDWDVVEDRVRYLADKIDWRKNGQYQHATGRVGGSIIRRDMETVLSRL